VTVNNISVSVSGNDLQAQLDQLRLNSPEVYERIDPIRVGSWQDELTRNGFHKDDFGAESNGGRGNMYVRAQTLNVQARAHGIAQLVELMRQGPAGRRTIVDLLGGDGLVRRVCALLGLSDVEVMTCDASPHMVQAAWATGVPALLQRAERQLFRTASVDGVLLAYGTHHIPLDARGVVTAEAYRVLRQGGTFLLHDFLTGSPMDDWFSNVVHNYSQTGHDYPHFSREEIQGYLAKAGFEFYELKEIDDPYTATGRTPEEAELSLGEYLLNMYGLCKIEESLGTERASRWAADQGKEIFQYPREDGTVQKSALEYVEELDVWRFTIPRRAIVGIGRKL
jgi:ubiquinone/menaquinone biosynthesis C-methylase UbiE